MIFQFQKQQPSWIYKPKLGLLFGMVLLLWGCRVDLPEEVQAAYEALPPKLDYNIHVKPILSDKCFLCHGPDKDKREAGLRLDEASAAYAELPETAGHFAIVKGKPEKSEVFHRILSDDPGHQMPTPESNLSLSAYEKAVITKWIEEGAEYKPHWAFSAPQKASPPKASDQIWNENPIDQFVFAKLKEQQLSHSEESDKAILLRRLSFDLTGLPPSPEEIQTFMEDNAEDAYEKQVDRLLASSHYGERMAMDWMDLARFADTHGYLADRYRDMSPWRDWVIKAFNENMSYKQFLTWQLAGDLLPNATREQILATGFNRLHPQNLEDGIIDEEFRVAYVSDRTDVLGQGLMGLTLGCAKCHDHKYDPISQKNYYELFSFFNNVNETGLISWEGATPVPTLMLPTEEQEEVIAFLTKEIQKQETEIEQIRLNESEQAKGWIEGQGYRKEANKTYPDGLVAHFDLENAQLKNRLNGSQKGRMGRRFSKNEIPVFGNGKNGRGLLLDGEAWLDLDKIGIYQRSETFSIALQLYLPKDLQNGQILHKGIGTRLHSYRGYHLALNDNRLELMMAHTWPENAIVEYANEEIPREEWVQLTITYDGSSKASGYRLYMNGKELKTEVEIDNLYKDIIFHDMIDPIYPEPIEPGLQIGARWRGKGIKGAKVDDILVFDREITALEALQVGDPNQYKKLMSKDLGTLTDHERLLLTNYYTTNKIPQLKTAYKALENIRTTYADSVEEVQEVMVMKEMPSRRNAFLLERGQYDAHGEEVFPNTPNSILAMTDELPKDRLGLAQWLTDPAHPLTARVAVNRYWQNLFGQGLVKTTEDFGNQGALPSHPALLDWLAVYFVENNWDVKTLIKLMVMSQTYRQDSRADETLLEKDPANIWLGRGPALRLTAEMMRDNALAASGLLNEKIGGESVSPYQPADLWKMNNSQYRQDSGDKLYRRSLYTIWKRSVPHPTLATFDAPDRSECTVRRQKTNTPLQALVLLNDPAYVEAAKVIGEEITVGNGEVPAIKKAFIRLTGREPNNQEIDILLNVQKQEFEVFKDNPDKALGWLDIGEYELMKGLNPDSLAANAVVASVIMNADVSVMKR